MKKAFTIYSFIRISIIVSCFLSLMASSFVGGYALARSEDQIDMDTLKAKIDTLKSEKDSLNDQINSLTWNIYDKTRLNWENIDFWLKYFEIRHPEMAKKHIQQECGKELKSDICIENRNLFGMQLPNKRETTATFKNRGHAGYSNYIESIIDYKLWQEYSYRDTTENYREFLKRSYAGDTTYSVKF